MKLEKPLRLASGLLLVGACLGASPAGAAEEALTEEAEGPPVAQEVEQGTALAPPGVEPGAFAEAGPPNCIFERGSFKAPPGVQVADAGDGPPGVEEIEPQRAHRPRRAPRVRGSGPWVHCD